MRRHIESKEQRDGRGVRQGNVVYGPVLDFSGAVIDPGAGIRIFVYLTERSFDGYVFQAIEGKAVGVGTSLTGRPRLGSRRAALRHRALVLGQTPKLSCFIGRER